MKTLALLLALAMPGSVLAATLTGVAIAPQGAAVKVGSSQQFTVTCTYADNSTDNCSKAGGATWSTGFNVTNAVTISNTGLATVVADPGAGSQYNTGLIVVTAGGISDQANIARQHVGDTWYLYPTPDYRNFKQYWSYNTPYPLNVAVGSTVALGIGMVANNNASGGQPTGAPFTACTWTSSNTSVATVDRYGHVTGLTPGNVTITCAQAGNAAYGSSAIAGWQSPGNFINLTVVNGGTGNRTWYVRPDGGTPYTATSTNGQCDGLHDAAYPGTGVNQPCAFGNVRYLWSDENTYIQHQWVIAGGDTVIVRQNPNGYITGAYQPASVSQYAPTNCAGDYSDCHMPSIPSGTAARHTRILGENYASCHADSAKTKLFLTWGEYTAFDITDSQFVDIGCFEVTDPGACAADGNYTNASCNPRNFGSNGIFSSSLASDINITDVFVHGTAADGFHGAVGVGVVMDHVHFRAEPDAGISMDDNPWYSGNISVAGGLTMTNSITEFTGCVEEYPIVHNYPFVECRDQSTGAYGDGLGTASTSGNWYFDHDIWRYNFQDGLDLLHSGMQNLTVTNSQSYGNDGQAFKLGSAQNVLFQNNIALTNCKRIGQLFGDEPASAIVPGVSLCRAADGIPILINNTGTFALQNNTYVGYQPTSFDIICSSGWESCTRANTIFQNNIAIGITNPNFNAGQSPGLFYTGVYGPTPPNGGWAVRDHNIYYGFRNGGCPPLLTGEICADAKFVNEPPTTLTNELLLDNYNFNLSSTSPATAAGVNIPGLLTDLVGANFVSPHPSMGALQYGATPSSSAPTITLATPQVAVAVSPGTATAGQAVTISAAVTSSSSPAPTGQVQFYADGTLLGSAALSGGASTLSNSSLAIGTHSLTVSYGGDPNYAATASNASTLLVNPAVSPSAVTLTVAQPEFGFNVIPGSTRRIFATVANGSTNQVNWTLKSGSATLSSQSGAWIDVLAPASGSSCSIGGSSSQYTVSSATQFVVEATSVDNPSAKADVTFNVCNPQVEISTVPFYRTLYSGQAADIQSLILGSVNQNVHWTISSQPNGGDGQLADTTSRDAVFAATVAGRYTLTATSVADTSKSASTVLYVTGHTMPYPVTLNSTEPVDCTTDPAMLGSTYDVGPSQMLHRIQDVPLSSLAAGSTIRIHNEDTTGNSPTVYHEYVQLSQSGTADQPIRVCGVPDQAGNLPIVDGSGATGRSDTNASVAGLGVITLDNNTGFSGFPASTAPSYIAVEGLQIRNASAAFSYTSPAGSASSWSDSSACLRVDQGRNTAFVGNDLNHCGNGAYSGFDGTLGWGGASVNVLWQGNNIHNNGSSVSPLSHQMQLAAWGEVVQLNRITTPARGAKGDNLQSRGVQGIFRYNYLGDGAAREMDLVDVQGAAPYMSFSGLLHGGTSSHFSTYSHEAYPADRVAAEQEAWNSHYVYGNMYLNTSSMAPIHFGMDHDSGEADRKGNLFWYNNTFYQPACASCSTPWTLFDTSAGNGTTYSQVEFPTVQVYNNIVWMDSVSSPPFQWNNYAAFIGVAGENLLSANWGSNNMAGGTGSGWNNTLTANAYQGAADLSTHLTGFTSTNLETTTTIPFDTTSWALTNSLAASTLVPSAVCEMPVRFSYIPNLGYAVKRSSSINVGASDTTQQAAAEMTSLTGPSKNNTRYSNCR